MKNKDNAHLCHLPSDLEIWEVVKNIGGTKASGPEGFTDIFFQKY